MRNRLIRIVAVSLLVPFAAAFPLAAGAEPALSDALKSRQQAAVRKLGQAALEYADFCAGAGAGSEARRWYGAAITIAGSDDQGRSAFAKIAGRPDNPDKLFQKEGPSRLARVKAAGKDLLQFIREARSQDCEGLVLDDIALWCTFAWDDKLLKAEGFEWYEPLRTIAPSADVVRFRKGDLRLNGKWLTRDEVAKSEREHAAFTNPWLLQGGWFEIHADVPLARAISTLNHACLWRAHLWGQLCAEMEIRRPEGPLPIFACATRQSLDGEANRFMQKLGAAPRRSHATGFYRNVLGLKLNPLFISLEEINEVEEVCPGSEVSYFELLGHELTHQLLTEGLKHREKKAPESSPTWVIEALGCWAEIWTLQSGRFTRHCFRSTPTGRTGTTLPSQLELARRMKNEFVPFARFSRESNAEFKDSEIRSYAQASLVGFYALEGGDNELRRCFLRVADATHCCLCDPESLNDAFKSVDGAALDRKLMAFLDTIRLEER